MRVSALQNCKSINKCMSILRAYPHTDADVELGLWAGLSQHKRPVDGHFAGGQQGLQWEYDTAQVLVVLWIGDLNRELSLIIELGFNLSKIGFIDIHLKNTCLNQNCVP